MRMNRPAARYCFCFCWQSRWRARPGRLHTRRYSGSYTNFAWTAANVVKRIYQRKFFYALTCEYCLSHYVTAVLLIITRYRLVYDSWRGYLMAGLSIVWIANFYMAIFGRLRLELKSQKLEIAQGERRAEAENENSPFSDSVSLGTFRERR